MSILTLVSEKQSTFDLKLPVNCLYLDYAATAPIDPYVVNVMQSVLAIPGNPHAKHHTYGGQAAEITNTARAQIAASISAHPDEIIFTSGATESNNLVIKGLSYYLKSINKTHIITTAVEHKSILEPLIELQTQGFDVSILPVKPCGMIEANIIESAISEHTGLICIQAVNNETGTIQPISEIASMLNGRDILFFSDCAQALGKIPFSVSSMNIDFASLSAHKVYGPQGIGALYVKADKIKFLKPLLSGGGQESNLRSGTLPVSLCAGFGAACTLIEDNREYLQKLRDAFINRIKRLNPIIYGHSDPNWNVADILNIRFPNIDNETLVMAIPSLAFGIGSACNNVGTKSSHVIKAITGLDEAAKESIRISFGRFTTWQELDIAADQLISAVDSIRQLQGVA